MQLGNQRFSLYVSGVSALFYAACSVFVALFPDFSTKLMASLFHIPNAVNVGSRVTLQGSVIGVVEVAIYSFVAGWIFAWVFNKSLKS